MSAITRPALRASETPIMSVKENRFHSAPSGPHQTPPSVSTPSTSNASALMSDMRSRSSAADPAQFLDDGMFAFHHALHAVAHRLLDNPHIAHHLGDAVGFQRGRLVRA